MNDFKNRLLRPRLYVCLLFLCLSELFALAPEALMLVVARVG